VNDYRFSINVVVRHPSCRAEEIAAQLGWEPYNAWSAGDARVTPAGTKLPGLRGDTMCSFVQKYGDEDFSDAVTSIVQYLSARQVFIKSYLDSGGTMAINIGMNGKRHSGMVLPPPQMLGAMSDLGLDLSVECFPDG